MSIVLLLLVRLALVARLEVPGTSKWNEKACLTPWDWKGIDVWTISISKAEVGRLEQCGDTSVAGRKATGGWSGAAETCTDGSLERHWCRGWENPTSIVDEAVKKRWSWASFEGIISGFCGVVELEVAETISGWAKTWRFRHIWRSCLQQPRKQFVTEAVDQTDNDLPVPGLPEMA